LYAVLHQAGYFSGEMLDTFRELGSPLHGHPIQNIRLGIEVSSGSLGQGLSFGLGHALAGRLNKLEYDTWVLLGDGECEEGQIWEAAMAAAHYQTPHLKAIVDYNKMQQTGPIERELGLEPFAKKWKSFGWSVIETDGHELGELLKWMKRAKEEKKLPVVIIAHTIKGKGVSFIENRHDTHGKPLSMEQKEKALEELGK
jgi:transketolase